MFARQPLNSMYLISYLYNSNRIRINKELLLNLLISQNIAYSINKVSIRLRDSALKVNTRCAKFSLTIPRIPLVW